MNEYLKKIEAKENTEERFKYIDLLLKNNSIDIKSLEDYYAENIKRAPEWMQKSNLEWLYRLMQDPKRLFKRYFHTNTKFIWNAMIRGK